MCGRTEYFEVKVGLHQGYVLSSLLFIIIMGVLAEKDITKTTLECYSQMTWCAREQTLLHVYS